MAGSRCCAGGQGLILFFFFNDTATTEIYTLSLHDALPICRDCNSSGPAHVQGSHQPLEVRCDRSTTPFSDRKSTRLNSSHSQISYAVFCLKKKRQKWKKHCRGVGPGLCGRLHGGTRRFRAL